MPDLDANQGGDPSKKTYNKKTTGAALRTAEAHSEENELKLYGSCFWSATTFPSIQYYM